MLNYKVEKQKDVTSIFLKGPIDENASEVLNRLQADIGRDKICEFNFRDIDYINSLGLRSWVNFFRVFQDGKSITFTECTPDIIMQINMVSCFSSSAKISSFYVSFNCMSCNKETVHLLENISQKEEALEQSKKMSCEKCGAPLELEVAEENYFEFLCKKI